jgi:sulfur transfer protein SufE
MLGSRAEAVDVVQDAYLRWHTSDRAAIEEPRRYLGTVVTRRLDRSPPRRAAKSKSVSGCQSRSWTKPSTTSQRPAKSPTTSRSR